jgi:hypothetical protein
LDASDAKKSNAPFKSSGLPMRREGFLPAKRLTNSSFFCIEGEGKGPGEMAFTRILSPIRYPPKNLVS